MSCLAKVDSFLMNPVLLNRDRAHVVDGMNSFIYLLGIVSKRRLVGSHGALRPAYVDAFKIT